MGELTELLEGSGGVLTRKEMLDAGFTDTAIRAHVRRGELVRNQGHYVSPAVDEGQRARRIALRRYPGAALSHFSAASLHDFRVWVDNARGGPDPSACWLTRERTLGRNETAGLVVRRAALPDDDRVSVGGMAATSPARTAADLARELPFREALVVLDSALGRGTSATRIADVLSRQRHWPRVAAARTALASAHHASESVLESLARATFLAAGLPVPELQANLWTGKHWTGLRVDFLWPAAWLVVEVDGLAKFEAGTVAERRRIQLRSHRRHEEIAELGYEILRFTWEDILHRPAEVCARIHRALERGRRRHPEPARFHPGWRPFFADCDDTW